MKIIYDTKEDMYFVKTEYPETEIYINTNDITEARAEFLERMTRAFDDTVCDKFKDDITKYLPIKETDVIRKCKSEKDHKWMCCGISTVGSDYRCEKCGEYKFEPHTTSTLSYHRGELI